MHVSVCVSFSFFLFFFVSLFLFFVLFCFKENKIKDKHKVVMHIMHTGPLFSSVTYILLASSLFRVKSEKFAPERRWFYSHTCVQRL